MQSCLQERAGPGSRPWTCDARDQDSKTQPNLTSTSLITENLHIAATDLLCTVGILDKVSHEITKIVREDSAVAEGTSRSSDGEKNHKDMMVRAGDSPVSDECKGHSNMTNGKDEHEPDPTYMISLVRWRKASQ
jgi:hypothetical protein